MIPLNIGITNAHNEVFVTQVTKVREANNSKKNFTVSAWMGMTVS
jgi:hypothetical protein